MPDFEHIPRAEEQPVVPKTSPFAGMECYPQLIFACISNDNKVTPYDRLS
ncbi:hypothetical protein A2U01_0067157 [Trifolium medium]|uniref:Uncharacterized protein n=1 Tax=Trifolium medium TaxID=97028 RepID=A0A392SAP8_9FABA|nr:hypothetical protein [Trifolium medium]